ncbi:MAG: hypothetical protein WCG93_12670 [Paludibacter sp.]
MKLFPKFIIEEENMILKTVKNHRDIAINASKVKGGGSYIFDSETNSYTLYGESYEFGTAKIEDIKKCIEDGKVYTNDILTYSVADKNNFSFYNGSKIIELLVCTS